MKPYILPVFLQIIGIIVIVGEIFIPSMGLLTAIALGLFFYSLYIVYTSISTAAGILIAGLDVVLIPFVIIIGMKTLAKSPLALHRELSKKDGFFSQKKDQDTYMNMEGIAVTNLRPAGTAMINSQRLDVVTDGEYISVDTPVVVTQVAGNRIIVEKMDSVEKNK